MGPQRIIGFVLFIIGGLLFVVGASSSQSVADQVTSTFTGRFTQATTWYLFAGVVAGVVGLLMLFLGPRRTSA